ncbi:MAG: 4Fe-4S dicluster domain-containing protein [candidate division WOR-3 bacterium]|nr:4Fe-4S dicluster domain-containing protein [candidate division WOR-3 bacterium]
MNFLLPAHNLEKWLKRLAAWAKIFYSFTENGKAHTIRYNPDNFISPDFKNIRTAENIKHFFFPSRGVVARFPTVLDLRPEPIVIMGVKNCDLRGVDVFDRVFLHWQPVDDLYKIRRENTIIISSDCPEPMETCFCNFVGLKPYPEGIADLNITLVKSGYLIEVFSKRGEDLVHADSDLFEEVKDGFVDEREDTRRRALERLDGINKNRINDKIPGLVEKASKNKIRDARDDCVECFSCLHCCPTCYCFLLSDYKRGDDIERIRTWDACYYAAYARVGGGANPRSRIDERFWNRFQCKFNYFYQYERIFACSGCGRCFSGCSAKIDIREVLSKL